MTYSFTVPIVPIAKARARVTQRGTYTPSKTEQAETEIARYWLLEHFRRIGPDVPITLRVIAVFEQPKSVKRAAHTVRPDASNILKLCEDALNRLAWVDDSQIVDTRCQKLYGAPARLEITVSA